MHIINSTAKLIGASFVGWGKPSIVRIPSTTIIFAGMIRDDNLLVVYKSTDNGNTWSVDNVFSAYTDLIRSFCIIRGESNNLYLALNHGSNNIVILKRTYTTGVWAEVNTFTTSPTTGYTVLGMNYNPNNGYVYIAWGYDSGTSAFYAIKMSTDYGVTWGSVVTASRTTGGGVGDHVIRGIEYNPADNRIYFMVQGAGSQAKTRIYNYTALLASPTFEEVVPSYPTNGYHQAGAYVIDSMSNKWVAITWIYTGIQGHLVVYKNSVASLDFQTGALGDIDIQLGSVDLGVDGSDNIYLFYQKKSDSKAYYRVYNVGTLSWGVETLLSSGQGQRIASEKRIIPSSSQLHLIYYTSAGS